MNKIKEYVLNIHNCLISWLGRNRKCFLWVAAIIYKIVLELYYILAVSTTYAYEGLIFDGKGWKYIVSWIVYIFMFAALPKTKDGLRETFLHLQFAITVVPLIVLYFAADQSSNFFLMIVVVLSLEIYILSKNDKTKVGINVNKNVKSYVTVFMMAFIIGISLIIILYGGFFGLRAFDFNFLYMIRGTSTYPYIIQYLNGWLPTIIPFFMLYYLEKKRYLIVGGLFLIDLILYMTLGYKAIYLSLVVIFCIYMMRQWKILIPAIYVGITGVGAIITSMFVIEKSRGISSLTSICNGFFGERFLFGSALNKYLYYDCFSKYPKVGFSDGLIGKCFGLSYPYKGSMGQTIFAYFNKGRLFESNSNTGYLGDSYGQAGFVGMIITGILLAYFVKLVCNIGENLGSAMMCSLMGLLIVNLNDGAFISIFLTGGWAVIMLLLIIYAEPKDKIYRSFLYTLKSKGN